MDSGTSNGGGILSYFNIFQGGTLYFGVPPLKKGGSTFMYSEEERRYIQQRLFLYDIFFAYLVVIGLLRRFQIISFKYSPNYVIAAIFLVLLVLGALCIVLDIQLKKKIPNINMSLVSLWKDTRLHWNCLLLALVLIINIFAWWQ